jgi:hypothetical protein
MMRGIIALFIFLTAIVICSGCIGTPADVAKETPGVLKNISMDISAMDTPTVESVLQPLKTSADYVRPVIAPTPTVEELHFDPIVGNWIYIGDSSYLCKAQFTPDYEAYASCSLGVVPIIQKTFAWTPEQNIYPWLRNYTITDVSDSRNYTVAYSEHTGRLTSEIMPGDGYLVKVS